MADPDARSMATSGRGSGMVGYNVQAAVDAKHHLIVAHEVTTVGSDRSQLSAMAKQAKAALETDTRDAVAERGTFKGEEILACDEDGITVTLPKPLTSGNRIKGRFVKQDFRYVKEEDASICPAGERLVYHDTNQEKGLILRRTWTTACQGCAMKHLCTTGKERRIARWEHEHVLEAVQRRLDEHPEKMRQRRETVEHPFGTIKYWMGTTHFQMKTLKTGRHRNGLACAGRQSQTGHEDHGHRPADRSHERAIGARRRPFALLSGQVAAQSRKSRPLKPRETKKSTKPQNTPR